VLVDRNCHKSLNYALNMSGAMPVYMMPRRNARGLIGPVPRSEMTPETVRQKLADSPLVNDKKAKPVLAVLTNSTYDGLCYNVRTTTTELSKSVPRIHYDEAWYAANRQRCLGAQTGCAWHGFGDLGGAYCMLDPIKVIVLTPGLNMDGNLESSGIPGPLLSSFLASRGIVVEKTEPYSFPALNTRPTASRSSGRRTANSFT